MKNITLLLYPSYFICVLCEKFLLGMMMILGLGGEGSLQISSLTESCSYSERGICTPLPLLTVGSSQL